MYSQIYGTLPIVHNTGGLADTVENYNQKTGGGTGFMFDDLTGDAVYNTVHWAVGTWENNRAHIEKMRMAGMKKTKQFSWEESAQKYVELYKAARAGAGIDGGGNVSDTDFSWCTETNNKVRKRQS
jgi:starch synthase